jgi:serine/threonine protein kinase
MKPSPMIKCPNCSCQNPPGNRFCGSCSQPLSADATLPTAEIPVAEIPKAPAEGPRVGRLISSDSVPVGGFTPGAILSDRYRIIGLLGRGGMGEVYRADDLKLGQPVALKFLPPRLADDPVRRERFFAEVRITRQLSHPNICRVYDIGEIDGRHFLSMEFIDGEDLASLIKRIGYLSNEKALDIARQLAAGLAAAHERGVLHRDLKPANIMLDGHGRVRITDFGLAIAAEDETQAAEIAGTPAYMAPEQLAGKGATVRSDMYSLGLVLYEIYTGKKAFTAATLAELRAQKEAHTPRAISEIREGMDPVVERLIRRCMERDPNARPASVAQLALALPGGDPLAAALAAGETPSPEMVAASGSREGLRPAVAWGLLGLTVVGWLAILAMSHRFMVNQLIPFEKSPDILAESSRQFIKKVGYTEKFTVSNYGFVANSDLLNHIKTLDKTANRLRNLDPKTILFWYRQSPRSLNLIIGLTSDNPPLQFSGEALVILDTEGRLVSFRYVPAQVQSGPEPAQALDWTIFFTEAGLNPSQWKFVDPQWRPLSFADTRAAWQSSLSNGPGAPVRIEAAALEGKPVYFDVIGPWTRAAQMEPVRQPTGQAIKDIGTVLLFGSTFVGGIFFARRNLRLGRGDRRTATRLALFVLSLTTLVFILRLPYGPIVSILFSPILAGVTWILYIAIEPFVRRRWPQILVSWTRLLSGDWRDPLVARHVLIGSAFGALAHCIYRFSQGFLPSWLGPAALISPTTFDFQSIMGTRFYISVLLGIPINIISDGLGLICLLIIMKLLLRNQKAALAACIIIYALAIADINFWTLPIFLVISAGYFFVLMRFGFIAMAFTWATYYVFSAFPIALSASAWYSGYGYAAIIILAVVVLYAFRTSLGGRPLLAASHIDD